ncbi:MAG: rod shape-determining protein MreD [Gammaproteobacteria bacterium]|nr:rod shape-determining protein MreD [Gammaproteobacteria bacterium]
MQKTANGRWVIFLSFIIAYLLAIVPLPDWARPYRPEWISMVLLYWVMALPYRVGIGTAWLVGIIHDVLEGSMLGLNSLGLLLIAYVTMTLHLRLRMFSAMQQAGLVLALTGINLNLTHWLQVVSGQTVSSSLLFMLGAVTSAVIWPLLFQLLRYTRRYFDVR